MKREYEMTRSDMDKILDACKAVPLIMVGGYAPSSSQQRANDAWCALGDRMGFDGMTVEPSARGDLFFLATPKETKEQERTRRIVELDGKISAAAAVLASMQSERAALEVVHADA